MTHTHLRTNHPAGRRVRIESDGNEQIIRLPADIRFEGDTVDLRRDKTTGDVILSDSSQAVQPQKAKTWDELFAIMDAAGPVPDDFMADRPMNGPADPRGVFDDEIP